MITTNKLLKLDEKLELRNREEEIVIVTKTSKNKYLIQKKAHRRYFVYQGLGVGPFFCYN